VGLLNLSPELSGLEEENEKKAVQLSIEQKKALIAEAKKRYSRDWKLHLPKIQSGFNWSGIRFRLH